MTEQISSDTIKQFQLKIWRWYEENKREALPWRRTHDAYQIWVSEVMLQQTQVERVIPKFERFVAQYPSFFHLSQASNRDLLLLWSGLGYNNRALRLKKAAQVVVDCFEGEMPEQLEDLLALPGIGEYTARAIQIFAFEMDVATVDTNIRRILIHELGLDEKISLKELFDVAHQVFPKGKSREWHYALMDYGAVYLTSRRSKIASTSKQSSFLHSRRWYRGRILKRLLETNQSLLLQSLVDDYQREEQFLYSVIEEMKRDGLVELVGEGRDVHVTMAGE
ncbi:MAG: Fe-S cluster assembly protein HesB [bacterium]